MLMSLVFSFNETAAYWWIVLVNRCDKSSPPGMTTLSAAHAPSTSTVLAGWQCYFSFGLLLQLGPCTELIFFFK